MVERLLCVPGVDTSWAILSLCQTETCGVIEDAQQTEAGTLLVLAMYNLAAVIDTGIMQWTCSDVQRSLEIAEDQKNVLLPACWKFAGPSLLTSW